MRIHIDTYKLSFRFIGHFLLFSAIALATVAMAQRNAPRVVAGCLALIPGMWLRRSTSCVIMHPAAAVIEQVETTLSLMSVRHERESNHVTICATGTGIRVYGLGPIALMTFTFGERDSARERYLRNTLIKFQRFIS